MEDVEADELTTKPNGYRLSASDLTQSPWCPHGPALLFEKVTTEGTVLEKFYACAACRSRRDCPFYIKQDSKDIVSKQQLRTEIYHREHINDQCFIFTGDRSKSYCPTCHVFVPNDVCTQSSHEYQWKELSEEEFRYPSRWIDAKISNRTNAQYFFSSDTTRFVMDTLIAMEITHVICIGTPSIHEQITTAESDGVRSFLLDLDLRLRQFYASFAYFNMFNNHFFDEVERSKFGSFLQASDKLMILVDPPYGCLLEALQRTITDIVGTAAKPVYIILFFPYYMEHQVLTQMPELRMSDYKVNYSNHSGYHGGPGGKKRGSPARMFTNIPLDAFKLPASEGYSYCELCKRYVDKDNRHCNECAACTTKDGPTYVHCATCKRCVKPSWKHCDTCERCELQDHRCQGGCFVCGDVNHKRKQCPRGSQVKKAPSKPVSRKRPSKGKGRSQNKWLRK